MQQQEKFDLWAVVELFGHTKIAGRCSEQNIAGTNMLRVDVPETSKQPAFTRLFGSAAIYAINPMDEASVKFFAEQLEIKPIQAWDVKAMLQKNDRLRLALQRGVDRSNGTGLRPGEREVHHDDWDDDDEEEREWEEQDRDGEDDFSSFANKE